MIENAPAEYGFSKLPATLFLAAAAVVAAILIFLSPLRRVIRESFMQRVTSAHYEILCPVGALSQGTMDEFAKQREPLFAALNKKIGNAGSNATIRIILDPEFERSLPGDGLFKTPLYMVSGTTIRVRLDWTYTQLLAAADAEALLNAAWGKPGNPELSWWITTWLVGNWRGTEIGMAAAEAEQRLGHKKVEALLQNPGGEISSFNDQTLLGAAWISEIAEFGGAEAVRKLYAAKMAHPNIAEAAQALGTTPLELNRKWQLWMYSYLAGMPSMPHDSGMPMSMPMPASH
jgi:hypothetical protein